MRMSGTAAIQAHAATAEGNHMQEAAGDRDILEEVDELVLVAEIAMEEHGGSKREQEKHPCGNPRAIAEQKSNSSDDLDERGETERDRRQRQSDGLDVADRHRRRGELRQPG